MFSSKKEASAASVAQPAPQPADAAADSQASVVADAAAPQTPEAELARLREEVQALQAQRLRDLAELRNSQQRWQREKQEAVKYAEADFARELLVVLDGLERTQDSAKTASDVQSVAEGVRIVHEQFLKVLKLHRIEPIEALGATFDPHEHEALLQQPSSEHPAGTVLNVVQRGYRMHERVIRTARVVISSGAPADQAASSGQAQASSSAAPLKE